MVTKAWFTSRMGLADISCYLNLIACCRLVFLSFIIMFFEKFVRLGDRESTRIDNTNSDLKAQVRPLMFPEQT